MRSSLIDIVSNERNDYIVCNKLIFFLINVNLCFHMRFDFLKTFENG